MVQTSVMPSKAEIAENSLEQIKTNVEKECWVALQQYFNGKGNGPEAKIAVVTLGTLAKEQQSKNNSRQLDLVEKRLLR